MAQMIKNLPAVQETWIQSLGWEDPLEKGTATHSSILAWSSMDRGAWRATVHGVAKSCTTEHLNNSNNSWKWKSLSRVRLFATPRTIQSMESSRPEHWSGLPFPSPRNLPNPGIKLRSPTLQVDSLPSEPQGKPKNTGVGSLSLLQQIFLTQESNRSLLHCR